MNRPIDLAAVRRIRAELADLVAQNPHLREPSPEDLALMLEDAPMRRKLDPSPGQSAHLTIRLPPRLVSLIDDELERLRAAAGPGPKLTRSDALRALLERLAAAQPTASPQGTPEAPRPAQ